MCTNLTPANPSTRVFRSRRITHGLEKYTSLSASGNGRLVASRANPTAGLWSVPILDRAAEERDVKPSQRRGLGLQPGRRARPELLAARPEDMEDETTDRFGQ